MIIFNNFKDQCTEDLLKLLDSNNNNIILVPPNCTDQLQPLDLNVNTAAKEFLRLLFHKWYAEQVCTKLE